MSFENLTSEDFVITFGGHIARNFNIITRNGTRYIQGNLIGQPGTIYERINLGLLEWEIDGRKLGSYKSLGAPLDLKEKIDFSQEI